MLFDYYYNSIKTISIILFYVLLGLLITILVTNNRLLDALNKGDNQKLNENLKTQKALIWTNFSIIVLFFLILFISSFYLFSSRIQHIHNRGRIGRNIIIVLMIILTTGMTYYINKTLDEITITSNKNELTKIYMIIPVISILSLILLMENFTNTDKMLTFVRNYFFEQQITPSITRLTPPLSPSQSSLNMRRYSPSLSNYNDEYNYEY